MEYVHWTCNKCNVIDDVFHSHDYCRISYNKKEIDSDYEAFIDKCASLLIEY